MNPQRLEAIKQGLTTYNHGQPCKYGHDSPRYTRSGQCVTCSKATSRKAYQDMIALAPDPVPQQAAKERKAIALSVRQLDCLKCGHRWIPRKDDVRQCPRCQSVWWDTPKDGQPTPKPTVKTKPTIKAKPRVVLKKPVDVSSDVWEAFNILRRGKRAPLTETALKGLEREANKAGITLEAALNMCVTQGWQGFQARFLRHDIKPESTILEPCTVRVKHPDHSFLKPCGKPSIRKQGMGFVCEACAREYQERQAKFEKGQP